MARLDLQKLLEEAKEEKAIKERMKKLQRKAPHPTNTFRVGSAGWQKALRKKLKLERQLEDKEIERQINRSIAQSKYHRKHKSKLNYRRAQRARKPEATFKRCKRRAQLRGQEWDLSFDEWWSVWKGSPDVWNPSKGFFVPAWEMRGGNHKTDTQMIRLDPNGKWCVENVSIQVPKQSRQRMP